jgi:peptide/nickel transport system permease protein
MSGIAADPQAANAPPGQDEDQSPLTSALRLLVSSGVGKGGILLFTLLIAISAYVMLTYPDNFGTTRWSNPNVWADNPRAAPPFWTTWLGNDAIPQQLWSRTEPTSIETIPAGEIRSFDFPFQLNGETFPSALTVTLSGLTYNQRPPVAVMTLIRPDGGQVSLANVVAPGPNPGEDPPYLRFVGPGERILLTSQSTAVQAITRFFQEQYPNAVVPLDIGDQLDRALFGRPVENGTARFELVPGTYTLRVQLIVAEPGDQLEQVAVVLGGTAYGWMGTDTLGRDLWEGLLYGFPIALLIATLAALASTIVGAGLGILSGYAGGATDTVIQRLSDIVTNVPTLPLLIFLVFVLGAKLWLIILVLVAFSWPGLTIVVRSMVLQLRSGQLVESARALGASRKRIMLRHVFPQVAPFIVAQMIFFAPGAILAEASLSFLGLGDTSVPTWGQMLQAGFQTGALYVGYWWWVIPPGVLIIITALAFMLLALALEPVVDPRLRNTV